MELNNMIQQLQKNIFGSNGLRQGYISLKPLECFLPEGINRKACIHIAGDEEVGKTSLGLEFAYRNPDYIFIYIDTYFKLQEKDLPDNVYIFRTNNIEEIVQYLSTLENKSADFIIIDSIANLLLPIEQGSYMQYTAQRYVHFNDALIKIIQKCCNLNICLILLNTINGNGKPSNCSTQILYQCSMSILILDKQKEDNHYLMSLRAEKWPTRYRLDPISTITLTGRGGM